MTSKRAGDVACHFSDKHGYCVIRLVDSLDWGYYIKSFMVVD